MYDLSGKVALVTGAGGEHGMGRAIANRLAQEGADVVVTDIVNDPYLHNPTGWEGAPAVVREIKAMGRQSMCILTDVTKADQVDDMLRLALERFSGIDILMNNAGSRPGTDRVPVVELEEAAWDQVQNVNLKGTFLCCRALARHMIERDQGGKIINMSSTSGRHGRARFAAYCASKFAVRGFTQSLAMELAPHHINVNAVCPGAVDTERLGYIQEATSSKDVCGDSWRTSEHREAFLQERGRNTPLGQITQPSDVARVAAFLASPHSDYLTGLSISIDGGCEMD